MPARETRREFVKKAAYVAPLILTLHVQPANAGGSSPGCGSGHDHHHHHHNHHGPFTNHTPSSSAHQRGPGYMHRVMNAIGRR